MKSLLALSLVGISMTFASHHHSHHYDEPEVQAPTDGWSRIPLSSNDWNIQIPCNHKESNHYSLNNGVHYFKINKGDPSHDCSGKTNGRSEMSLRKKNYNSGRHQF